MFHKVREIVRADGISGLARRSIVSAYRRAVCPCLPSEPIHFAGIPTCYDRKRSDLWFPTSWLGKSPADQPDYEAILVAGLNETVRPGDTVVIVGGGAGVTSVFAALRTGPSGAVDCFEGSKRHVSCVKETAARNSVTNVRVHHAIVAKSIVVYGTGSDLGPVLPAAQLPPCDVLELDCEGAEAEIVSELTIRPRVILVETHGKYGAPTDLIASLLEKRGYIVSHRGVMYYDDDVQVLLGVRKEPEAQDGS